MKAGSRRESYVQLLRSYPDSDKVNSVSEGAENLYTRLLAQSDDAGRFSGDPQWIVAKLFTARFIAGQVTADMIAGRLVELETAGLIKTYVVDGKRFLELQNLFRRNRSDVKPVLIWPFPVTYPGQMQIQTEYASVTHPARTRNGHVADPARGRDVSETDAGRERDEHGPLSHTQEHTQEPVRVCAREQPNSNIKRSTAIAVPASVEGEAKAPKRRRRPLGDLTIDDLRDDKRLLKLFNFLANAKRFGVTRTDGSRLAVFALAERALEIASQPRDEGQPGNPVAFFIADLKAGRSVRVSQDQEERGRKRLLEFSRAKRRRPKGESTSSLITAGANRMAMSAPRDPEGES